MSGRIRIEGPDGKLVELLDVETSRQVYAMAKAEGVSPRVLLRRLFKRGAEAILAKRNKVN